jgi:uncharacterized phage protein gp47/JayE
MANLTVYTFSQLVSQVATAIQSSATALYDFTVGSTLRAIAEATSGVVLWLQALILQLLTVTRASTSVGSDLDSFMADYGVFREPAVVATGQVTFSRFTSTQQALIPIGASVQTSDGTETFSVTIDTTNSAYNATLNGYVIAVNTSSVNVPVQAQAAGSGGNIQAGSLTVITTPIPGVDTVTNGSAYANGLDAETDADLRARFVLFLASLSKATKTAVGYAITSVQQGLSYTLTENQDYDGTTDYGFFWVAVDDGTGFPSNTLLTNVSAAIDFVRALCIRFQVYAPVVETANVAMTLTTGPSYTHSAVVAAVTTALTNFINNLTLGNTLPYTQLAAIAYDVPGVINVSAVTLNSATADLTATSKQVVKSGTIAVS